MKFVLVHGAWSGSWGWKRVAERLRALGHEVYTPSLTGQGERTHLYSPAVDLETHVADVLAVIKWERLDDFVLCGHSYGGMVVTPVADRVHQKIRALVYLDAFLPKDGQCLLDLIPADQKAQYLAEAAKNDGRVPPTSRVLDDPDDQAWCEALRVPHPIATLKQPARLAGNVDKIGRRIYILCSEFKPSPFHKFAAEVKDRPGWMLRDIPCHHLPNISMPDDVVRLLLEAGGIAAAKPRLAASAE